MLCPCSNKPNFSAHTESNPPCILLKAFAQFADSRHIQLSYMFASSFQVYTCTHKCLYRSIQFCNILFHFLQSIPVVFVSFQKPAKFGCSTFHVFASLNHMTGQMTIATMSPISFQVNHHF